MMKKLTQTIFGFSLALALLAPTATVLSAGAESEWVNNTYKAPYELNTGIIGYPTVTAFIDNEAELNAIKGLNLKAEIAPAMVYLRVKAVEGVLQVCSESGETLTTLTDVLNHYTRNRIIPAFYVAAGDTETASVLQGYIREHEIEDAFVVSPDVETLHSVIYFETDMGTSKLIVGGILEIADAGQTSLTDISRALGSAGARCVLVTASDFPKSRLDEYFESHFSRRYSIYVKADGAEEMQKAVLSGATGICVDDWQETIEFIESFDEATLTRPINIMAHRGMDVLYQENTLEGIYEAARCDVAEIEVDPRLTKDDQIVLMHDADVTRVAGLSGTTKDYTLAQLKAMEIIVNGDAPVARVASLEDVFQMYQKYALTTPIVLDAKETDIRYFQILYDLIDEYDMWDCITSVGVADGSHSKFVRAMFEEKLPQLYGGVGSATAEVRATWQETMKLWHSLLSFGTTPRGALSPYYDEVVLSAGKVGAIPYMARASLDRAIRLTPYQFDTEATIAEAFYLGLADFNTGWSAYLADITEYFRVEDTALSLSVGQTATVKGVAVALKGTKTPKDAVSYKVLSGADVVSVNGKTLRAKKNGVAVVLPFVTYQKGGISYRVYSDAVTVTVGGASATAVQTSATNETETGCSAVVGASLLPTVSALLFGVYALIKKRGDNE